MVGFMKYYEDETYIIYQCVSCGKHFIRRNKKTNVETMIPYFVAMTYLSLRFVSFSHKEILNKLEVKND